MVFMRSVEKDHWEGGVRLHEITGGWKIGSIRLMGSRKMASMRSVGRGNGLQSP